MPGTESAATGPRWDLDPVYASFDDPKFASDKAKAAALAKDLARDAALPGADPVAWLKAMIRGTNEAEALIATLGAYCYAKFSTDTRDARATAETNAVEELKLPLSTAQAAFRNSLKANETRLRPLLASDPDLKAYRFVLEEELFLQGRQMPVEMEELAADLSRAGADAWGRLQESLSSTTQTVWDEASGERKTVIQLRNLAFDPERSVRQKAFEKELECWKGVEIPMAAALNGVKGFNVSLDRRRGWKNALERAAFQSRIEAATLEALISALEESQGLFRRYLKAKARMLGIETCAFYDLFAPLGASGKKYTWLEMRDVVVERFSAFDPAMGAFANRAFEKRWIDAEPREGKVGGAYCMDFPLLKESRILCNNEGSFHTLTTIAHELGHAWHHECVKDLPYGLTQYPMTLAETASIFAETVVFEDAIGKAKGAEKASLAEFLLRDGCQIMVDILSRFYFERDLFERRTERELPPQELCELMLNAQKKTYGEGLDPERLHPYMWAVKGHYYYTGLSFYNYPYAFGQLFGLGLYARYREEGPSFAARYRELLAETGRASAEDVAVKAGYDIKKKDFWLQGMKVFAERVDEFEALAPKA